jgi:hypothetical protein
METLVREGVLFTELERLERWFKEYLNDLWDIETTENGISATFNDGQEIEMISVDVFVNEYGFVTYNVTMEYAKRDNEIIVCDSCHECDGDYCPIFEKCRDENGMEIDLKKLDEYFQNEVEKHENKPKFELRDLSEEIIVKPTIITEECHVDVTHYHYYRGVSISAEIRSFERLKALMEMRQFFYSLIDCS